VRIELGSERLAASVRLAGCRVGIVCNPASVDHALVHVVDRVMPTGATLAAIFGPQHGVHSDAQENMVETAHASDAERQVPVHSLYSETREPTPAMLEGIDALVIDLQDVGTRIYTYIYTMANCLVAARRLGLRVIVCDRPNPIGGAAVEGPMLIEGYESFVGQYPIPMRHGMTIGELARLFNEHFGIGADLEVVPMAGWRRAAYHADTDAPWVLPSPNLPTPDTALVYPGTVLFEGTNVSEGRGTTRPFELIGAPGVVARRICRRLNDLSLEGVHFRPAVFEPTFHKHAKRSCGGCQIHVMDRERFRPVAAGVALVSAFRAEDPDGFRWREPPYEYEYEKLPFDILAGTPALREQIERGVALSEIVKSWKPAVDRFMPVRDKFLMYE
jgi:uncharacterized protein YbbC (DUF1343 family)